MYILRDQNNDTCYKKFKSIYVFAYEKHKTKPDSNKI